MAMRLALAFLLSLSAVAMAAPAGPAKWPAPKAAAVPQADGYVTIPGAAVPILKTRVYRAVFDATQPAGKPTDLVPALNMVGSELNALVASGVPLANAKFVVVFHGAAMNGILDEAHYKAKFGVSNPNLAVIEALEKAGTSLFVCGQNLAFEHINPMTLTPQVKVATDALIVLMTYQDEGYALLNF
jgi:intracellular sulfur oxidation DsrE/DsrF family protein